jgi:hypothetical protein
MIDRPTQHRPGVPLGSSPAEVRRRLEALERVLERAVTIPGINRKVGLDAIAGLVPVGGDLITAAMGLYLVWEARNLGLPKGKLVRMLGNVGFDAMVGSVPVLGDVFDFMFRSNTRNLNLIKRHLDRYHPETALIEG